MGGAVLPGGQQGFGWNAAFDNAGSRVFAHQNLSSLVAWRFGFYNHLDPLETGRKPLQRGPSLFFHGRAAFATSARRPQRLATYQSNLRPEQIIVAKECYPASAPAE
ncbi:hypothetical protein [Mesorhizobium sp. M1163]|uniref:hypothetical protein n=1 Tax=Mesorhizobium sp. M1163 TaxID=2957065 RepID=UPI00333C3FBE